MLDQINNILGKIDNFVWGVPLIVLILLVGIFLTIRLKGLQIRKFPLAVKYLFENEKSGESGEVSSFAALCTALSATIGTGNIVGHPAVGGYADRRAVDYGFIFYHDSHGLRQNVQPVDVRCDCADTAVHICR